MKNPVSGILVLNKPHGISSRQALDGIRRVLPRIKMGHAGTLDPIATGVLVVCIGKTTRLIPFVQRMQKEYQTSLRLGQRSETHDLETQIERTPPPVPIERELFERCLARFRGDIMQVPPQHSAVHVEGRRAYELARAGRTVQLLPRSVHIDRLVCTRFEFPDADLEIACSSGTYVRSLVRDIGAELGCGAVMTRLVRTRIGMFRLESAVDPTTLTRETVLQALRSPGDAVQELPTLRVPMDRYQDVSHGRVIETHAFEQRVPPGAECVLVDLAGNVIAMATVDASGRSLHPHTVLIAN